MFKIRARAIFLNRESKFESELEPLAAWTGLSAFTICSLISNLTRAIERRTYRSFGTYINCAGSRQSSKFGRRVRSSELRVKLSDSYRRFKPLSGTVIRA